MKKDILDTMLVHQNNIDLEKTLSSLYWTSFEIKSGTSNDEQKIDRLMALIESLYYMSVMHFNIDLYDRFEKDSDT